MKNKIYSMLFILGGITLGWFALNNEMLTAHYHLDWVCDSGRELITNETPSKKITMFNKNCSQTEDKSNKIFSAIYWSSIYSVFIAFIMFFIGYKIYPVGDENKNSKNV